MDKNKNQKPPPSKKKKTCKLRRLTHQKELARTPRPVYFLSFTSLPKPHPRRPCAFRVSQSISSYQLVRDDRK